MIDDYRRPFKTKEERQAEREAEIPQRVAELRSRDPREREKAVERLGILRGETAALLGALRDQHPRVRSAAAEALGNIDDALKPEVIDELLAAIDDQNDYVCAAAIRSLGRLKAAVGRDQILDRLEDNNLRIVREAIVALGRLGVHQLAHRLAGYLDAPNFYLRAAAAQAVAELDYLPGGRKVLVNLEVSWHRPDSNPEPNRSYIEALAKLQVRNAVPVLIAVAQHSVGLRRIAVEALMELDPSASAPALATLLSDPSAELRRSLVQLMLRSDYRVALPLIRPLLRDSSAPIRNLALDTVAHWQDRVSNGQVRHMCYQDSNPFVRAKALQSLYTLHGNDALPDVIALAKDRNTEVRRTVIAILEQNGTLPATAVLALQQLAATDPVPELAQRAADISAHHTAPSELESTEYIRSFQPLAVPAELVDVAPALLATLERWQQALPALAGQQTLEEISSTDGALTRLIILLRSSGVAPS